MTERRDRLEWLGHVRAVIDFDGVRLVTDRLLADRFGHLRRMTAPAALSRHVDAALVSHLHLDHQGGPPGAHLAAGEGVHSRRGVPSTPARERPRRGCRPAEVRRRQAGLAVGAERA